MGKITHKELRVALRGDAAEWRAALERARDDGWTYDEVMHVVRWHHPSTYMVAGLGAVAVMAAIAGLFS